MLLLTQTGSVVYFDPDSRTLRSGPVASSPRHTVLQQGSDGTAELVCSAGGAGSQGFTVATLRKAESSFGKGLLVLDDERPSKTTDSGLADTTEPLIPRGPLLPLSRAEVELIASLTSHSWHRPRSGSVIPAGSIVLEEGFRMKVAEATLHLASQVFPIIGQEEACVGGRTILRTVDVLHDGWKLERLELFAPLVLMTVFGAQTFLASMRLAVMSLEEIGNYTGDYLIVTDAAEALCRRHLAGIDQDRISYVYRPAVSLREITAARLRIDREASAAHQPVLYMDCDIICNAAILPLLQEIMGQGRVLFPSEFQGQNLQQIPDKVSNWFGRFLSHEDLEWDSRIGFCLNSGIFGARNVDVVSGPFRTTLAVWDAYRADHNIADIGMDFEQPFLAYVLQKTGMVDLSVMDRHSVCVYGDVPGADHAGKGLVHFNSGVGQDKHARMASYLDGLLHLVGKKALSLAGSADVQQAADANRRRGGRRRAEKDRGRAVS